MSELAEADWVKLFYSLRVKLLEHVRGQNLVRLNEVKCIDLSPLMTHTAIYPDLTRTLPASWDTGGPG